MCEIIEEYANEKQIEAYVYVAKRLGQTMQTAIDLIVESMGMPEEQATIRAKKLWGDTVLVPKDH